jgi:hypothetical protein
MASIRWTSEALGRLEGMELYVAQDIHPLLESRSQSCWTVLNSSWSRHIVDARCQITRTNKSVKYSKLCAELSTT